MNRPRHPHRICFRLLLVILLMLGSTAMPRMGLADPEPARTEIFDPIPDHSTLILDADDMPHVIPDSVDPARTKILEPFNEPGSMVSEPGQRPMPPATDDVGTLIERPPVANPVNQPVTPATDDVGTLIERPASVDTPQSGDVATGSSSQPVDPALARQAAKDVDDLQKKVGDDIRSKAAEAETAARKALESGTELDERTAAKLRQQVTAANLQDAIDLRIREARKLGIPDTEIARILGTEGAYRIAPVTARESVLRDLETQIVHHQGKTIVESREARQILERTTRLLSGNATPEDQDWLKQQIQESRARGGDFLDELKKKGTMSYHDGFQPLVTDDSAEKLKNLAREQGHLPAADSPVTSQAESNHPQNQTSPRGASETPGDPRNPPHSNQPDVRSTTAEPGGKSAVNHPEIENSASSRPDRDLSTSHSQPPAAEPTSPHPAGPDKGSSSTPGPAKTSSTSTGPGKTEIPPATTEPHGPGSTTGERPGSKPSRPSGNVPELKKGGRVPPPPLDLPGSVHPPHAPAGGCGIRRTLAPIAKTFTPVVRTVGINTAMNIPLIILTLWDDIGAYREGRMTHGEFWEKAGLATANTIIPIKDFDDYMTGKMDHQKFWTNTTLWAGGMFLPYPLNAAIAAHQLGAFAGSWAAGKLIEAYRRGDPVARALVNWLRRHGWINANDPTFVAVGLRLPPMPFSRSDSLNPIPFTAGKMAMNTGAGLTFEIHLQETRLAPTDLPWARFDRPAALLAGTIPTGSETQGIWTWQEDPGSPDGQPVHISNPQSGSIHYLLLSDRRPLVMGENLVQYLKLDSETMPQQIVLQLYDEELNGAHRLSLGQDLLPFDDRAGYGLIQRGNLPPPGVWIRLRIPLEWLGLSGHRLAGLAFIVEGGKVHWGRSTFSGSEDNSPWLSQYNERDRGGNPESDLLIPLATADTGELHLELVETNGRRQTIYTGSITTGQRTFWWQGPASRLPGGRIEASLQITGKTPVIRSQLIQGNPALVARILYPPAGAAARQTLPIFGQAGGKDFTRYVVDYRPLQQTDTEWKVLVDSSTPAVITRQEMSDRIEQMTSRRLRGTVYGNLASLDTGSALHHFPFAPRQELLPSGWLEIRLRCWDKSGNQREDRTDVRIGEVATGQNPATILSPDGQARLIIPPLSLPRGMATLSIDQDVKLLPPGLPELTGGIYNLAPEGLRLQTDCELALRSTTSVSLICVDRQDHWKILPTERQGEWLSTRLSHWPAGTRVYASVTPETREIPLPETTGAAPWMRESADSESVCFKALHSPLTSQAGNLLSHPLPLTNNSALAMIFGYRATTADNLALLLRYDNDVSLLALGQTLDGVDRGKISEWLRLYCDGKEHGAFFRLSSIIPPDAQMLRSIELVRIIPSAWQLPVTTSVESTDFSLLTLSIAPLPDDLSVLNWTLPAGTDWRFKQGESWQKSDGKFLPLSLDEGWLFIETSADQSVHRWPLLLDSLPPRITFLTPPLNENVSSLAFSATITDAGAGVLPDDIQVTLNNQSIPDTHFSWDGSRSLLQVRPDSLPCFTALEPGSRLEARIRARDRLGHQAGEARHTFRYQPEPIVQGKVRQLTITHGHEPCWRSDGQSIVYVGEQNGQVDLFEVSITGGTPRKLTDDAARESTPAIHPRDGRLAFIRDGELVLHTEPSEVIQGKGFHDPAWWPDHGLLLARGEQILLRDEAGQIQSICTAMAGATVENPEPVGSGIVFTQSMYHKTLWFFDPAESSIRPLSDDLDNPLIRDMDASAAGADDFYYARAAGKEGLWKQKLSGGTPSLQLATESGFLRHPVQSPQGNLLAFESDRSGRQEIWIMELAQDIRLQISPSRIAAGTKQTIVLTIEGVQNKTTGTVTLHHANGKIVTEVSGMPQEIAVTSQQQAVKLPATIHEGQYFLQLELPGELILRSPLAVYQNTAPPSQQTSAGNPEETATTPHSSGHGWFIILLILVMSGLLLVVSGRGKTE